jgi:hypothetical protein
MTMSSFVVLIIGGLLPKKTYFYCVSNVFFLLASRPEQGNRVNIGKWSPHRALSANRVEAGKKIRGVQPGGLADDFSLSGILLLSTWRRLIGDG